MPEATPEERLSAVAARLDTLGDRLLRIDRLLADRLGPPPPGKPARPPVERRHLKVVAQERKAA